MQSVNSMEDWLMDNVTVQSASFILDIEIITPYRGVACDGCSLKRSHA